MIFVMEPGEKVPLTCSDCEGADFALFQEIRDGKVDSFHTKCCGCGKRGVLRAQNTVTVERTFEQFWDPDEMPECPQCRHRMHSGTHGIRCFISTCKCQCDHQRHVK